MKYSPHLRTAVLLTGSGTAGAYHAGVLRALHEAGIKIDLICARGIGVAGALFAAIDAAPKTWEDGGVWRRHPPARLYRWRPALRIAAVLLAAAAAILLVPLIVLATGLVVYPFSFLVQMISVDSGNRLVSAYASWIGRAFSAGGLPTVIPRLITLAIAAAAAVLAGAAIQSGASRRTQPGYRDRGFWWARLIGTPWSSQPGVDHILERLWELFRGPANARRPQATEFSRRYVELLLDNMSQPGFRELMVAVLDLETRTDLIFAALREEWRQPFFHGAEGSQGDLVDLAGVGRTQLFDALAGALSLPVLTEPHVLAFSPESYWKGEAHRVCDRPAAAVRLLHELGTAGVEQVIVISASADRAAPHRLDAPHGTLESRVSEHLAAAEAASLRDAIRSEAARFQALFVIQPPHNPVGPFDFEGVFDARSDRFQSIAELIDRGYEDAYRQFIEPAE